MNINKYSINFYLIIAVLVMWVPLSHLIGYKINIASVKLPLVHMGFTTIAVMWAFLFCLRKPYVLVKENKILFGAIVFLVGNILLSESIGISVRTLFSFIIRGAIFGILFYIYLAKEEVQGILIFLCGILMVSGLLGILEHLNGTNFPYHELLKDDPMYRYVLFHRGGVVGPIGHPLPFSFLMAMFVPLVLVLPIKKIFRILFLAVFMFAIFVAESRIGLLMAVTGISLVVFFKFKSVLFRVSAIIFLVCAIFMASQFWGGRFLRSFSSENHRMLSYKAVGNMIKDNPLWGVGLGSFPEQYDIYREPYMDEKIKSPDNQFLRLIVETGVFGFLGFMVFIGFLMRRLTSVGDGVSIGLLSSVLTGCLGFMTFDGFYWFPTHFIFCSILGLGWAYTR